MTRNKLSGDFAAEIGIAFPELQILFIGDNQFTGRISRSLANISSLIQFDINSNGFIGSFPDNIGNLKNLNLLDMDNNRLGIGKEGDLDFIFLL